MKLENLETYNLAREVSKEAWPIYEKLDWRDKKVFGDQWISAIDSMGANIAEGFGRYHYLDKNKFNYNARGSLLESKHWLEIMKERDKITEEDFDSINEKLSSLHKKLNNYINATKKPKQKVGPNYSIT